MAGLCRIHRTLDSKGRGRFVDKPWLGKVQGASLVASDPGVSFDHIGDHRERHGTCVHRSRANTLTPTETQRLLPTGSRWPFPDRVFSRGDSVQGIPDRANNPADRTQMAGGSGVLAVVYTCPPQVRRPGAHDRYRHYVGSTYFALSPRRKPLAMHHLSWS